ncbi:hypothetical protein PENANT_c027G03436 [Penicillium antarcticum]|uniref:DNA (cytosine-5)-methyltransferase 1 replication foci domain-containing protein n=1 Tax=Penicillium antarcticum TaxID=416450 RepID=A0A1V6PWZ3_9EURO|nr:hypothetical protein PENANT_c027G03436 [Penicillium antarcticum]
MTSREEAVLLPIDPSITDENDWWEFSLTDVKIMKPGKMLYANLLDATEENPVQVIGVLEQVPKNQTHLVREDNELPKRMIIDDVTHYAYGQTEDKSIELWVAGKAGWYDISLPARGYVPTYNRMVQAIDMLYFLVDKHQQGKKQINPSFRSLCEQYVYHSYGGCEDREQSAEVFSTHGPFLLRCMLQGDGDVDWKITNVFVHLRRQFYDEYKQLMDELFPSSDNEEDTSMDEPELSTPRHQPAAISKSQADAIYQLLKDLREEGHLAKRRLHLDLLAERLASRFPFSTDDAEKIIAIRAPAVLEMMEEEDTPGFRWSRYVIHRELTNAATKSAPLPRELLTPLNSLEESSDDERYGRTQKSVLRPKINSISNKVTGKRNRNVSTNQQTVESNDEDDGDDMDEDTIETPSKTRGHELIRDPFSASRPRTRSFLSASSGLGSSSLMKSLFKDNIPKSSTATSTLTAKSTPKPEPISVPIPTPESSQLLDASGDESESDTWVCRMPGCEKVITNNNREERKKIIGDHAGDHEWETQMKVELMETERRMHSAFAVTNLMQYVVDQHVQQMRTAFPEMYSAPQHGGQENGLDGTLDAPSRNGDSTPESQDSEDEEIADLVNGNS